MSPSTLPLPVDPPTPLSRVPFPMPQEACYLRGQNTPHKTTLSEVEEQISNTSGRSSVGAAQVGFCDNPACPPGTTPMKKDDASVDGIAKS